MFEGSTIGSYRVLRRIGAGGMGEVFVAEHMLLGRKAAIKVLLPELSAHSEIVQRFFNEAKAVTQIADPGIVQVFDFGIDAGGRAFIVMELLEGEPLDVRLVRVGPLGPLDAIRMMRLVCVSLYAAHAKGIIHRDLKPENIFIVGDPAVTGGERPKILDFGIAKLSRDEPGAVRTRSGVVMGTPVYMSPEQCRGAGEVDHRSDIYSIGCVLMTILTGLPPFCDAGSGELIVAHMRSPPPLASSRIPGLPPVLDQIVARCLEKDPDRRFQSMAEFAQALAHAEPAALGASSERMIGAAGAAGRQGQAVHGPGSVSPSTQQPPHEATPGLLSPSPSGLGNSHTPPEPIAGTTTTLRNAAGATTVRGTRPRSLMTIGAGVVATAAVAVLLVAISRRAPREPPRPSAGSQTTIAAPVPDPVVPDAAIAASRPESVPTMVVVPVDAGVDAPPLVEVVPDAAAPSLKHPKRPPKRRKEYEHERPSAPSSAEIDRGD